jgi:hypothetical protein
MGIDYRSSFGYGFMLGELSANIPIDKDEYDFVEELCEKFGCTFEHVGNMYGGDTDYFIDLANVGCSIDLDYSWQTFEMNVTPETIEQAKQKAQLIADHFGVEKIETSWIMTGTIS